MRQGRRESEKATKLTRLATSAAATLLPVAAAGAAAAPAPELAALTREKEAATRGPWQASQVGARGMFTSVHAVQAQPAAGKRIGATDGRIADTPPADIVVVPSKPVVVLGGCWGDSVAFLFLSITPPARTGAVTRGRRFGSTCRQICA